MRRFRGGVIRSLAARGCDVTCLVPSPESTNWSGIPAKVHDIPLQRSGLNLLSDAKTMSALRSVMKSISPDLVVSYSAKPIAYGLRAAREAGVPRRVALFTGLGSYLRPSSLTAHLPAIIVKRLVVPEVRQATCVLCQNPDDLKYIRKAGWTSVSRSALAPATGVDLQQFSANPPLNLPSALFAGRLVREKRVLDFVQAAKLVRRHMPAAKFCVAGAPESIFRGCGNRTIQRWSRDGDVTFVGWQADMRPMYAKHAVFVLPSMYGEGVPRSGQEAMASGRAIVTTDWPGCRELIEDGVEGFLVPPRDPKAIADRLLTIFSDQESLSSMQRAARRRAELLFDLQVTSERLASLILE